MLLPGQLNKAEGTVLYICSHVASIQKAFFLPSGPALRLSICRLLHAAACRCLSCWAWTRAAMSWKGPPACGPPRLWATDTQGALTACHRGQAIFGMQQCQRVQILHIRHTWDFTSASFPGPVCTGAFGGLDRTPCPAVCCSTRTS